MRLRPGLANNLTVLEHNYVIRKIFNKGCTYEMPDLVFPLCNNTARDSILAMMPACNAQGILADWKRPEEAVEDKWHEDLVETPVREETDLIHPTKDHELDYIAERAEAAGGAGSSRAVASDPEEEGGSDDEEAEEQEEQEAEEPPALPAPRKAAAAPKTSKRPAEKKQKRAEPAEGRLAGKETGTKSPQQQASRQQAIRQQPSRKQVPRPEPSRQEAPPTVKRARAPSPPTKASGSGSQAPPARISVPGSQALWDISALDEEVEDE